MSVSTSVHLDEGATVKGRTLTTGEPYLDIDNGRDHLTIFLPDDEHKAKEILAEISVQVTHLYSILISSRSHDLS